QSHQVLGDPGYLSAPATPSGRAQRGNPFGIRAFRRRDRGIAQEEGDLTRSGLRHRLIRSQPYSDGSELDECEVVVGVFFVSRGDGAEVLEFVEEALDEVSVAIKKGTEGRRVEASGHRFDARPGAAFL